MTVSSSYTVGPDAEDITIEKDGGILKEILVKKNSLMMAVTLENMPLFPGAW